MNLTFQLLRDETLGKNYMFHTPYGERVLTYADYTASGKSLKFIEKYLLEIQKCYANTHTEDDMTGAVMTNILHKSEKIIKKQLNADKNCFIIPSGTGATGAIESFAKIAGIYIPPATKIRMNEIIKKISNQSMDLNTFLKNADEKFKEDIPVVFIGPYEHHSNILIWRESIAEVVEIELNNEGTLDLEDLEAKVSSDRYKNRLKIGSFSAASNVTGVVTPVYKVAEILHNYGASACFDFAASGPYVEINMNIDEKSYFDAVYFSPHKFIGGPGSAGILVVNSKIYDKSIPPTVSGGGTVSYVSSFAHDYLDNVEEREKAGTPGILQVVKAALAIELKNKVGIDNIIRKEREYTDKVMNRLNKNEKIEILGPTDPDKRISIISLMIKHKDKYLHPRFLAKLFNDLFGIQTRAGCACAGPYGHRLLNIDNERSGIFRNIIHDGCSALKPGWLRFNLHYVMIEEEIDFICDAIEFAAEYGYLFLSDYVVDIKSGDWFHKDFDYSYEIVNNFGVLESMNYVEKDVLSTNDMNSKEKFEEYLSMAKELANTLINNLDNNYFTLDEAFYKNQSWFYYKNSINNI